jgi:hypothetical protein
LYLSPVIIGQSFQESDDVLLFLVREFKVAELALVDMGWIFSGRPTCDLFSGTSHLASGQNVARVIEMHNFFQNA